MLCLIVRERKKELLKDIVPRALPLDRFELNKTNIKKKKRKREKENGPLLTVPGQRKT